MIVFHLFVFGAMIYLLGQPKNETNEPNEKVADVTMYTRNVCVCVCVCLPVKVCVRVCVSLICCIGDMNSIESEVMGIHASVH